MANNLIQIFNNHNGKVSDKWQSYLYEWEDLFSPYRNLEINLFEIGVHNGGSLEIWAKYFPNALNIVGCDNNQECKKLEFSDRRISLIIGDVNSDLVINALTKIASEFNIIIDDGSHKSGDIINSFSRFFKLVKPGGVYIIEDLHTSYWEQFQGGLNNPYSALNFLKNIADIINFEHWRINQSKREFFQPYEEYYGLNFDEIDLCTIHSITFLNSLCIIRKGIPEENNLGRRMVVGSEEIVSNDYKRLDGTSIHDLSFDVGDNLHLDHFSLIQQNENLITALENKKASIDQHSKKISELNQINQFFRSEIENKNEEIRQYENKIQKIKLDQENKVKQIEQLLIDLRRKKKVVQRLRLKLEKNNQMLQEISLNKKKQEKVIETLREKILEESRSTNSLKNQIIELKNLSDQKDADLEDRNVFIHHINETLREFEEEILSYALDISWKITRPLRKIQKLFSYGWPAKINFKDLIQKRPTFKNIREYLSIKRSGLFDEKYYLRTYSDVRRINIDPIMHFVMYGYHEKRNPSPFFSTEHYFDLYPEVAKEGKNPLIHYINNFYSDGEAKSFYDNENRNLRFIDLTTEEARKTAIEHNAKNPPNKPDIIILPIIDWDYRFQRPQQLACQLAKKGHRIFYLQTKVRQNINNAPFIKSIRQNIYSVQLSCEKQYVDVYSLFFDEQIDDLETSFQELRDHFLINSAIIMVDTPIWRKLAIRLKNKFGWKLIYDCMDLHIGFSESNHAINVNEKLLIDRADKVFVSSRYLYDHVNSGEKKVTLVPNGSDFDFFHQASHIIPNKDMQELPKPILGYFGAIADWFDTELIGELAFRHPEWTFVLIGDTHLADLDPLHGLPNIHLLGEKPYSKLPSYLSHFDVCLIPFKDIPLTNATNPVKLYEYLSAGKPVVATNLHELSNFNHFVYLANKIEEWEDALRAALNERSTPELLESKFAYAKENTWEIRTEKIGIEIRNLFPKVSIIIVSFNNSDFTKLCLESLKRNTSYPNYEIIIVDNGSNDQTIEYLNEIKSEINTIRIIFNDKNLGFSKANNQGARIANGEYFVFLNNDTKVSPGWIHQLLWHLSTKDNIGMVGPVSNGVANEAKIEFDCQDAHINNVNIFAANQTKRNFGSAFEIKVLALFCTMISKDLFEYVNGLDERFEVGMFEDDDLALKIQDKGLKLICARDVFIHHTQKASFKLFSDETYKTIFSENKKKFEEKWNIPWIPHSDKNTNKKDQASEKIPTNLTIGEFQEKIISKVDDYKGVFIQEPIIYWDIPLYQRPQHIATALGKLGYLVIYKTFSSKESGKGFRRVAENVWVTHSKPTHLSNVVSSVYSTAYPIVDEVLSKKKNGDEILVYEYIDHISSKISGNIENVKKLYQLRDYAFKNADFIVASSRQLASEAIKKVGDQKVLYVPNGVDVDHYRNKKYQNIKLPDHLLRFRDRFEIIVGYFGAISPWLWYKTLAKLTQMRDDIGFVYIGPDYQNSLDYLPKSPNTLHLNAVNYQFLPAYAKTFDVCFIPFAPGKIAKTTSPLKLYEYFALEKPIVATSFMKECASYDEVFTGNSAISLSKAIDAAFAIKDDSNYKNKLSMLAEKNSWMQRAELYTKTFDFKESSYRNLF